MQAGKHFGRQIAARSRDGNIIPCRQASPLALCVRVAAVSGEVGPKKPKRGGMAGPAVDAGLPAAAAIQRIPPSKLPADEVAVQEMPQEEQQFLVRKSSRWKLQWC